MTAARKSAAAKTTTTRKTAARKTAAKRPARKAPAKKTAAAEEKRPAPGRPPLLEVQPELLDKIVTFVRSGAFPERAAVAVGVSERSHYAWLAAGRDELERREAGAEPDTDLDLYVRYATAIEKAIAEAEMLLLGSALKGGATGSANMQILERRFRDRWGAKGPAAPPAGPAPATGPATGLDMLEQKRLAREQATR